MSSHRLPSDLAYVNWKNPDPGTGKALTHSGPEAEGVIGLVIGAGAETNTLPDPDRPGLRLTLVSYSLGGGTRVITAASIINVATNTIITFSAVDQTVILESVPYSGNTPKARWQVVLANGATLS